MIHINLEISEEMGYHLSEYLENCSFEDCQVDAENLWGAINEPKEQEPLGAQQTDFNMTLDTFLGRHPDLRIEQTISWFSAWFKGILSSHPQYIRLRRALRECEDSARSILMRTP